MTIIAKTPLDKNLVDTLCDLCNSVPTRARLARQSNDACMVAQLRDDLVRLINRARQVADFAEGELAKLTPEG